MTKKTIEKKLKIALKALNIYGNMDFWQSIHSSKPDVNSYYTSLEVNPVKDGWEWAQEAIKQIEDINNQIL